MEAKRTESFQDKLVEARAEGIADPVILTLDNKLSCSHAIYEDLHDISMAPGDIGYGLGTIEKLSRLDAIRLLRKHGKEAGNLFGDILQKRVPTLYSHAILLESNSILETYTERRVLSTYTMGYEKVMLRMHQSEAKAGQGKSTLWLLELDSGDTVPLCCPVGEVFRTGFLTVLGATRKGWVERDGRMLEIEAFDADLAAELLKQKEKPTVVAEAVRALRKLGSERDRWLTSVLWGRRPLRSLARRVESELSSTQQP